MDYVFKTRFSGLRIFRLFLNRSRSSRRCLSLAVLFMVGVSLLAILMTTWNIKTQVEYLLVGNDAHQSVLRLKASDISLERLNISCSSCEELSHSWTSSKSRRPTVGVFLVLDTVKSFIEVQKIFKGIGVSDYMYHMTGVKSFINCKPSYDYTVYILYSVENRSHSEAFKNLEGVSGRSWIELLKNTAEECRSKGTIISIWLIKVKVDMNIIHTLNYLLVEAYFDNVVWYDLLVWSTDQKVLKKWSKEPTETLAGKKNIGVVVGSKRLDCRGCRRVFLHKRHYEIFGHFFPMALSDWTPFMAVRYLLQLYSTKWSVYEDEEEEKQEKKEMRSSFPEATDIDRVAIDYVRESRSDTENNTEGSRSNFIKQLRLDKHVLNRYVAALNQNDCLHCGLQRRTNRRVIAMSLYGDDPKYTLGAVRNAQILPVIFPGWRLWIYCQRDLSSISSHPSASEVCVNVPIQVTRKLQELGVEIKYVDSSEQLAPMLWRFLPIDDSQVEVFISRDSDSRLSERDYFIVSQWLETDSVFHCIRDHPSHSLYPVSGGLWGVRTKRLAPLFGGKPIRTLMAKYGQAYLEDMRFLEKELWPVLKSYAFCHDSFSCSEWSNSHPFPIPRQGYEHIGQVFDAYSIPRLTDIEILKSTDVNSACEPIRFP